MNVRRKEPEKCTLETPACLTKSLRIYAALAPATVVPVRGICGCVRPARHQLPASSAGLARKLPPKPSGVGETLVRIAGKWMYLFRAVDAHGQTVDFYLSETRDREAAKL